MSAYRLLGSDGRQYGPVTAEQVAQWIKEGRANAYTRVCPEGSNEWKMLSDFPAFAAALGPKPVPGPVAPPVQGDSAAAAEALAAEILARDYCVDISGCISRGWELVKARFWLSVGATALILLLTWLVGAVAVVGPLLLTYVLWTGLDWMFLKMLRGQPVELSDAFAGFSKSFVPLMLFSLVAQLLTFIGFALCILPGIYLSMAWLLFSGLLIIDKGLDFWPAMELSRKVVTRHWWQVFGLFLLCWLIGLAGVLACFIGMFVALPLITAAMVVAYEDIFGSKTLPGALPAPLTVPAPTPAPAPAPAPAPTPSTPGPEPPKPAAEDPEPPRT